MRNPARDVLFDSVRAFFMKNVASNFQEIILLGTNNMDGHNFPGRTLICLHDLVGFSSRMSDVTEWTIRQEHLSIVIYGHDDSGKSTSSGRLLFELDGTHERELDKLTQEAERLGKSSLAIAFYMDRQEEQTERGGIPERKFDGLKQDAELLEKSSSVCTFFMVRQKENNDVNKMDCFFAGQEQERYDETSRDLKYVLIMCELPSIVMVFNERYSAHSRHPTDSPI